MTKPPVVTDEMVRRFQSALNLPAITAANGVKLTLSDGMVRRALEAALTEPEDIPVSEGMVQAGRGVLNRFTWIDSESSAGAYLKCNDYGRALREAFCAMERQRRAEEGASNLIDHTHCPKCGQVYRTVCGHLCDPKRRKDD